MSFRTKVLDALDIKKDHVRIPVYQTFLNPSESATAQTTTAADPVVSGLKPYAVSRCINDQIIGPKQRKERLEVLGFVVGDDPGTKVAGEPAHLPDALDRTVPAGGVDYSGIHYLGGLYDSTNPKLMKMRKSAITPTALNTLYTPTAGTSATVVNEHTHSDWPHTATEQAILLNDSPAADALYYHKTQLRFLLTGIDDVSAAGLDQASNHRGTVRLLVLRPRVPAVRTRVDGTTGDFKLNHDYLPDWHTELFYDRGKQLGGKLDPDSEPHTVGTQHSSFQHGVTVPTGSTLSPDHLAPYPNAYSKHSSHIVTYGITKAAKPDPQVELDTNSPHYGHMKVTAGKDHQLTPTDLLMSKVNKQKYAVLHDEVFTLDSLHHGAAAQHIVHVNIPYNKKVKFSGRQPLVLTSDANPPVVTVQDELSTHTFDTPLNMASRPIVLFLSYNQKISASVEGWTAISEC